MHALEGIIFKPLKGISLIELFVFKLMGFCIDWLFSEIYFFEEISIISQEELSKGFLALSEIEAHNTLDDASSNKSRNAGEP